MSWLEELASVLLPANREDEEVRLGVDKTGEEGDEGRERDENASAKEGQRHAQGGSLEMRR